MFYEIIQSYFKAAKLHKISLLNIILHKVRLSWSVPLGTTKRKNGISLWLT